MNQFEYKTYYGSNCRNSVYKISLKLVRDNSVYQAKFIIIVVVKFCPLLHIHLQRRSLCDPCTIESWRWDGSKRTSIQQTCRPKIDDDDYYYSLNVSILIHTNCWTVLSWSGSSHFSTFLPGNIDCRLSASLFGSSSFALFRDTDSLKKNE